MDQFEKFFSDERIDKFDCWMKRWFAPVFIGFTAGYFTACIVRAIA